MSFIFHQRVRVPVEPKNTNSETALAMVTEVAYGSLNSYEVEILEGAFQYQRARYFPTAMTDASEQITLEQWCNGTHEQRTKWLTERALLDTKGKEILNWAQLFRDYGADVPESAMVGVWLQLWQGADPVWRTDTADNL